MTPAACIVTLCLHDALPISARHGEAHEAVLERLDPIQVAVRREPGRDVRRPVSGRAVPDRKSTRLNSSHLGISYAVVCLKKKTIDASMADFILEPPILHVFE